MYYSAVVWLLLLVGQDGEEVLVRKFDSQAACYEAGAALASPVDARRAVCIPKKPDI